MGKVCFFIGHSDAPESIYPALQEAIERHITEYSVTEFYVGNYGRFDRMAARAVQEVKKIFIDVKLFLVLPYPPETGRPLPDLAGYDGTIYPEGMETIPYKLAILQLNRKIVRKADYIIAYVRHSWGGAAQTLERAKVRERRNEIKISNIEYREGDIE